jgi:DNA-binding NtrC family response regulator
MKILIVDDERGYREELSEYLESCGFEVLVAKSPSAALKIFASRRIDIAILDLRLPEMDGISLMEQLLSADPGMAVIIISGHGDMDSVIRAMHQGAADFFQKPFNLTDIRISIERTKRYIELSSSLSKARETCSNLLSIINRDFSTPMIGNSAAIRNVMNLMRKIGHSKGVDVLITGESGTGKELVARGIHNLGANQRTVFFDVNCTAVPDTLFESEFFGHVKNAFTGAATDKKGWFEIANGGTLFLDEVGDMPLAMQAKLLRVLEERKIRRIGSARTIDLDLRVIASTNKDLQVLMGNKLFREDLYYRLNRFPIQVLPLRQRRSDIVPLAEYYSQQIAETLNKPYKPLSAKSLQYLKAYDFPGNVRELKNMIEKAIILAEEGEHQLNLYCFPELMGQHQSPRAIALPENGLNEAVKSMECDLILAAMQRSHYNKSQAAKLLKITRTSLNRRILKHKLDF